ncbi:DNA repair protein SWI5 homolog [Xenia sp. Carnegie-2017]|uniref:DNA repair protein SWI5 homolog n=1 Tax=Xenia sp. Carnegie-2017 TaxID=2897299 RepID=UPI001F04B5A3|nr:DNA repair protein SWI5 homolog [Xenia sp. Carnegie-2017]
MASYSRETPTNHKRQFSKTKLKRPFKSPMMTEAKSSGKNEKAQQSDIDILKEKITIVEDEINGIGIEYSEDELQLHIDRLHEYNDIKDLGQLLLGKLAECQGKTTKMLYEEYGLDVND